MSLEKPAYGQPCNGCGLCCENEICPLGQVVFPRAYAPCPALESDGERKFCGLVANPSNYAPIRTSVYGVDEMRDTATLGVGVGVGCDARLIEEIGVTPPLTFTAALREFARAATRNRRRILRVWSNPR